MAVVLVTGGSRGIGRAIVELLVAEGHRVAFTWRTDEARARALEETLGGEAKAYPLDTTDRRRPQTLVAEAERDLGPLDGLVNNAGERRESILAMTSDQDWEALIDINLGGAFRCCRAALPGMMYRRKGSIVNVASLSAVRGVAGQAAYAASKAGLLGMTRALAREAGRRNVRANAVLPGFVVTDMTSAIPEAVVKGLRQDECLPYGVSPEAVAGAVAFLLSDRALAITGQTLNVDAGATA
jgi:3-oxoacyl-[acyl-carrier protein] reductase